MFKLILRAIADDDNLMDHLSSSIHVDRGRPGLNWTPCYGA